LCAERTLITFKMKYTPVQIRKMKLFKLVLLWFAISFGIYLGTNIFFAVLRDQKVEFPTPN